MIRLGDTVTDSITGFTGVAIGRCDYLNGCEEWELQPKILQENGEPVKARWFDEQRLTDQSDVGTGGPADHPPAPSAPSN